MLEWRQKVDSGESIIVGLNKFRAEEKTEVPPFAVKSAEAAELVAKRLKKWKASRDSNKVREAVQNIKQVMQKYDSIEKAGILMPALLEAAREKCTLGEMMGAIYEVTGGRVYSREYRG